MFYPVTEEEEKNQDSCGEVLGLGTYQWHSANMGKSLQSNFLIVY